MTHLTSNSAIDIGLRLEIMVDDSLIDTDLAERRHITKEKPEVVVEIQQTIERHQQTLTTIS